MEKQPTLVDRVGGRQAIDRLYKMQYKLFAAALGSRQAHFGLHIDKGDLCRFENHLIGTLQARQLSDQETHTLISRVNTCADEVTGAAVVSD